MALAVASVAWAVFILQVLSVADALRENNRRENNRIFDHCRVAKCTDQTYELKGELGTSVTFQDCQVNYNKPEYDDDGSRHCQETCSIVYQEVSREVKVKRRSGKGPQVCQMKPTEGICEDRCCLARCSNESYELRADGNGPWHFQDCQLDKSLFLLGEGYKCQERCTVLHSQEPAEVEVLRKPGADVQPECQLKQVRLQDAAMDFVDQLENKALTLQTNRYGDLPLMNKRTVISFLQQVKAEVIHPEFENSPGHGYSRQILSQTNQTIAIIGDLHGQLFNLIAYLVTIKEKYEGEELSILDGSSLLYCDPRMHYLFMGDYVDRGERGVELLLLLLAYKARCPQGVTLLQGNHEESWAWEYYGFLDELKYKLSGVGTAEIESVVEYLPYVAVVPGFFMAMHGGISPEFYKSCTSKNGNFGQCLDKSIGRSTAWADPHEGDGFIHSHRGGEVYKFGQDKARTFLASNGLNSLFRGHEVVKEGYTQIESHGYIVATVFSAADYVGLFCVEGRMPAQAPNFGREMFSQPGMANDGAFVLVDPATKIAVPVRMSGEDTRAVAAKFTGGQCMESGLLESRSHFESPKTDLESFMQENHQRLGQMDPGKCSLNQAEADSFREEERLILRSQKSSEDLEFEARKRIDSQGEALVHGESAEICKSMKKDHITLEVYNELHGSDEEILKKDIEIREEELEG